MRAGYAFRAAIPEMADGDVLAVQLRDIRRDRVDWSTAVRTRLSRVPGQSECLRTGDILFAFRGTRYFAVALEEVPTRCVASTQFMLLRVPDSSKLLPEFLAWQLNQGPAQRFFHQRAAGTAQRSLRRRDIEAVTVAIPSLRLQQSVMELVSLVRRERDAMEALINAREQQLGHIASTLLMSDRSAAQS